MLGVETMTLIPRFPSAYAVSSAKARSLEHGQPIRNTREGLTPSPVPHRNNRRSDCPTNDGAQITEALSPPSPARVVLHTSSACRKWLRVRKSGRPRSEQNAGCLRSKPRQRTATPQRVALSATITAKDRSRSPTREPRRLLLLGRGLSVYRLWVLYPFSPP
jgi:hypothetical protein